MLCIRCGYVVSTLDTTAAIGEEIVFQDKGNPKEKVGVQMGFGEDPVGALPGTRNHRGKVSHRDSLPVQPVPDYCAYIHKRVWSCGVSTR